MKISGGSFYFILYLVLFLFFNCIGVENHSNPLKVAMEIQKAQYILNRFIVEYIIQSRMLVIDAMTARGVSQ
jgi:hypothetical protein